MTRGAELTLAVSAVGPDTVIAPWPETPAGATTRLLAGAGETALKAPLLAAAFVLLLA